MKFPPPLIKQDTIAITCPSGFLERDKCLAAAAAFSRWGYKVIIGDTVGSGTNYFAGTDDERYAELQSFLDQQHIRAVFMGRGGYGMSRIIDRLDFTAFKKNPKWICGFSDITLLHLHLQSMKYASLHSAMCVAFMQATGRDKVISSIKQALAGTPANIAYHTSMPQKNGKATGKLIGGNLAMVAHAVGSVSMPDTQGAILFLEDIGEHLYKIDRMLLQLKRAGLLDRIKGMVFGQFTDVEDTTRPFGASLSDILLHHFHDRKIPVALDAPVGHVDDNQALVLGATYELTVFDGKTTIMPKV